MIIVSMSKISLCRLVSQSCSTSIYKARVLIFLIAHSILCLVWIGCPGCQCCLLMNKRRKLPLFVELKVSWMWIVQDSSMQFKRVVSENLDWLVIVDWLTGIWEYYCPHRNSGILSLHFHGQQVSSGKVICTTCRDKGLCFRLLFFVWSSICHHSSPACWSIGSEQIICFIG
jgi:hypothetical protein